MRANTHYYIIMALVAVMAAVLPARAGVVSHSATFASSGWSDSTVVVDNTSYRLHTFAGLDDDGNSGAPMLPCKAVTFSVPYNATNFTVTLSNSSISTGSDSYVCYPIPQPIPTDGSGTGGEVICDSTIYHTNAFYPASPVSVVADGFFMGENHLVTVAIYPMQVNPVTRAWRKFTAIDVTLSYDIDTNVGSGILMSQNNRWRAQDQQTAQQMVANPTAVAQNAPPTTAGTHYHAPASGTNPIDELGGYEYTIITPRALNLNLTRLLALKRQKGLISGVVYLEDILAKDNVLHTLYGTNVEFRPSVLYDEIEDDCGTIRNYLRGAISQKNLRYLLLIGDSIPYRYGGCNSSHHYANAYEKHQSSIPTDLYYSELNTNWDIDGDEFYGEPEKLKDVFFYNAEEGFDYASDLYVGRLKLTTQEQLDNYIDKLIIYETGNMMKSSQYLRNGFIFISDSFSFFRDSIMVRYESLFDENLVSWTVDTIDTSMGSKIVNFLNTNKMGFISMGAHGAPDSWDVGHYPKGNSGDSYSMLTALDAYDTSIVNTTTNNYEVINQDNNGVDNILNYQYPYVMFTSGCTTMPFDNYYSPYNNEPFNRINLGQSVTLGRKYGGVAYIGFTRPNSTDRLERYFGDGLLHGIHQPSMLLAMSRLTYGVKNACPLKNSMANNLFGDPELTIWTSSLNRFNNIAIHRQDSGITINGLSSNDTISVFYCDNVGNAEQYTAIGNSFTLPNVSPNSCVMISKHNYVPFIAPLILQNIQLSSQYVFATNVIAGKMVDANRTNGEVCVPNGSNYVIRYTDEVRLMPGFSVEKGGCFTAKHNYTD